MTDEIVTTFLRDIRHGGPPRQLTSTARRFARFVDAATTSLDIAVYDFRLTDPRATGAVVGALLGAAERGVRVRLGYDAGRPTQDEMAAPSSSTGAPHDAGPGTGGPPGSAAAIRFAELGADPAPPGTPQWVTAHFDGTAVATRAIEAGARLMHSKYLVRDGSTVWTGTANFTDDAWSRQENVVLVLPSQPLAADYAADFEQMWATGSITDTGTALRGTATIGTAEVRWDFAPGDGGAMDTDLAALIGSAQRSVAIASMVLTSHAVLSTLVAVAARGVALTGIYDGGQMDPIEAQWAHQGSTATLAAWREVKSHLVAKLSTPYSPTSVHDFMHHKTVVVDATTVATGSANFSAAATHNAENRVTITDPRTARAFAGQISAIVAAYRPS